jgi:hypothetical protein
MLPVSNFKLCQFYQFKKYALHILRKQGKLIMKFIAIKQFTTFERETRNTCSLLGTALHLMPAPPTGLHLLLAQLAHGQATHSKS